MTRKQGDMMRSKLLYLFSGVLLAAVVLVGAGLLRAQVGTPSVPITITSDMLLPKWEYAWVSITGDDPHFATANVKAAHLNGTNLNPVGHVFDLFNQLGSEGWEYVEQNNGYFVFKRRVVS